MNPVTIRPFESGRKAVPSQARPRKGVRVVEEEEEVVEEEDMSSVALITPQILLNAFNSLKSVTERIGRESSQRISSGFLLSQKSSFSWRTSRLSRDSASGMTSSLSPGIGIGSSVIGIDETGHNDSFSTPSTRNQEEKEI